KQFDLVGGRDAWIKSYRQPSASFQSQFDWSFWFSSPAATLSRLSAQRDGAILYIIAGARAHFHARIADGPRKVEQQDRANSVLPEGAGLKWANGKHSSVCGSGRLYELSLRSLLPERGASSATSQN